MMSSFALQVSSSRAGNEIRLKVEDYGNWSKFVFLQPPQMR